MAVYTFGSERDQECCQTRVRQEANSGSIPAKFERAWPIPGRHRTPRAGPPHAHKEGHEAESGDEDRCAGDHPRLGPLEPRPPRASARAQGSSRERRCRWAGTDKNGNSAERTRLRSRCAPRQNTAQDNIESQRDACRGTTQQIMQQRNPT